jgi:endonuclease YncB( thermonuclease family)
MPYPKFWRWSELWRAMLVLALGGTAFIALIAYGSPPLHVHGQAEVLDGGMLRINGAYVRLWDIRAPAINRSCVGTDGAPVSVGRLSASTVTQLSGGAAVDCVQRANWGGVIPASCSAAGRDLSLAMLDAGAAWSSGGSLSAAASHEDAARNARRGVWALQC